MDLLFELLGRDLVHGVSLHVPTHDCDQRCVTACHQSPIMPLPQVST